MLLRENGWLVGLAALVLAGTIACQRQPETPPAYGPAAQTTEDRDTRITTSVQARFYSDDDVRGRHIQVHSDDGVVTLRGSVDSEGARQRALEIARGVEGVERVEDALHVGAPVATTGTDPMAPMAPGPAAAPDRPGPAADPARPDLAERRDDDGVNPAWTTTKIQARYFVTPGVAPWNVDVTTSATGVVTLEGEVDSEENRQRAVQIARETDGVTRVEDRLRIQGDRDAVATTGRREADDPERGDRPDGWITTKVQSKYFLDNDVRGRSIEVATSDGIVSLRGTVRSERERRQAVALARNTDGVRDVRDELTIQPHAEGDRPDASPTPAGQPATDGPDRERADTRSFGDRVDDGWITTKIQSQLYLEQDVRGRSIEVETRDGVVRLRGQVATDTERQLAEQIAGDTDGVSRVDNQISVRQTAPGQP